jgi:hypothetical protein
VPKKSAASPAPEAVAAMIAEAAYYKAVQRDFMPGHELSDWLAAETEINATLTAGSTPSRRRKSAPKAAPSADTRPKRSTRS